MSKPSDPGKDTPLPRRSRVSYLSFGTGLWVSLAIHALLAVIMVLWVVNRYVSSRDKDDPTFAQGGGGGGSPQGATGSAVSMKRPSVSTPKIVTKSPTAIVTLPDMQTPAVRNFADPKFSSGRISAKGRGGSGSGGGLGAGHGTGTGDGNGPGSGYGGGFVGRFLGAKINAKKVALYLDNSDSMKPFLARVESEARRIFPRADVFKVAGVSTSVYDGRINATYLREAGGTVKPFGQEVLRLKFPSVGAWFDTLIHEDYDAIVIFSDFMDGVTQMESNAMVFREILPGKGNLDNRTDDQRAWERRWIEHCRLAMAGKAPKVYIFSTAAVPQSIWKRCAEASGGGVHMVDWLTRKDGKPPEDNIREFDDKSMDKRRPYVR